ncbi:MAG: hypothetical protein OXJ52_09740, partial [Oligoflexia bacterium]|nr:hypothetical protein [Oligoflexia bacterium]
NTLFHLFFVSELLNSYNSCESLPLRKSVPVKTRTGEEISFRQEFSNRIGILLKIKKTGFLNRISIKHLQFIEKMI